MGGEVNRWDQTKSLRCGKNNNGESKKKKMSTCHCAWRHTQEKQKKHLSTITLSPTPQLNRTRGLGGKGVKRTFTELTRRVTSAASEPAHPLRSTAVQRFVPLSFNATPSNNLTASPSSWTVTQSFFTRHRGFAASLVKKVNPEARKEVATFAKIFSRQKYQGTGSKYIYYIYIYILYICKKSLTRGP